MVSRICHRTIGNTGSRIYATIAADGEELRRE